MKLDEVKYSVCQRCGRRYPLAHCISGLNISNGKHHPDRYFSHNNPICLPCIRSEKGRIDARGKIRGLTYVEIERREILEEMMPEYR